MALQSQVYYLNGQESYFARDGRLYIADTLKTSHWEESVHFVVRP
jgi:hypothetical protein